MKDHQQITPEKLIPIAAMLGQNWRYNATISNETKHRGHYLSNGAGLYIHVGHTYGKPLVQWELCYLHPTHQIMQKVVSVGCDLAKPARKIIADLNSRLLAFVGEAYQTLATVSEEEAAKRQAEQLDTVIIESLKRVLKLNPYHDHRYCQAYRIENEQEQCIARLKKWRRGGDSFCLCLDDLTAEKVIKIMQIANE